MKIHVRKKGDICIMQFRGQVKLPNGPDVVAEEFDKQLEAGERLFVFDMLDVPWLDTAGIASVISCHKRVRDRDGVIKLVLKGKAHDLFTMYELQRVFEIFEDLEEALASFAKQPAGAIS